jgi:hypothetical protein
VKGGNNDYRTEEDLSSDESRSKNNSNGNGKSPEDESDSLIISNKDILSLMGLYTEGYEKKGCI